MKFINLSKKKKKKLNRFLDAMNFLRRGLNNKQYMEMSNCIDGLKITQYQYLCEVRMNKGED